MAATDVIGGGNIEPRALEEEMRTAYLDYAMSVIVGRALPDVRDGLKPVHRRILYSMDESGRGPARPYSKSAAIVGDVMGQYHPHGDSAIYDTLVRIAQDFSMRYMLIDRRGMRLVIELKRDAIPEVVLNQLYKHTQMQSTFGVNMVALVENVPRTLPLKRVLVEYVRHQREVIVRRTKHELGVLERRVHVLEGLLIAQDNIDEVIETIRASRDREAARGQLMERFQLSEIQASAILDLRLSQLTALEAGALRTEHADKVERIAELRAILGDEDRVLGLIKEELLEISDRFGDERRTLITDSEDEIDIEDLIADQQMVITMTKSDYIKSLPLATYRQQHRGGRGVAGVGT